MLDGYNYLKVLDREASFQDPHDEEGLEEEDPIPNDILQPSLVHDLVQKGVGLGLRHS